MSEHQEIPKRRSLLGILASSHVRSAAQDKFGTKQRGEGALEESIAVGPEDTVATRSRGEGNIEAQLFLVGPKDIATIQRGESALEEIFPFGSKTND
jgi:hypothetical protein